jgi:hypothetical protein
MTGSRTVKSDCWMRGSRRHGRFTAEQRECTGMYVASFLASRIRGSPITRWLGSEQVFYKPRETLQSVIAHKNRLSAIADAGDASDR